MLVDGEGRIAAFGGRAVGVLGNGGRLVIEEMSPEVGEGPDKSPRPLLSPAAMLPNKGGCIFLLR